MFFAANYNDIMSFDLSNYYYPDNFINLKIKNVEIFSCLCKKEIELSGTKEYDRLSNIEELKDYNNYNALDLESYSSETSETNNETNLDRQLERSHNIKNIRLQANSLEIDNLRTTSVLSGEEIIKILTDNLTKYKAEYLKINGIIGSIDMNTEAFFHSESKSEFVLIKELLPILITDIINSLNSLDVSPENVPLPEQTE
jgi:hypothetical protein